MTDDVREGIMRKLITIMALMLCLVFSNAISVAAETYTYDELNRITSVEYEDGQKIEYTYDDAGNILSITVNGEKVDPPEVGDDPGEPSPVEPEPSIPEDDKEDPVDGDEDSTNQSDDDSTTNDQSGKDQDENDVVIEKTSGDKSEGDPLAKTATNMYRYLFAGFILAAVGALLYLKFRRKTE